MAGRTPAEKNYVFSAVGRPVRDNILNLINASIYTDMTIPYNEKIVISGNIIEHYKYQNTILPKEKTYKKNIKHNNIQVKRLDNIIRAKKNIKRLIWSNCNLTKFITLTFNQPIFSPTEAKLYFDHFIKRMNRNVCKFNYVAVYEYQPQSKRVHFHLLADMPYLASSRLEALWGRGYVKIRRVNHSPRLAGYLCKYLAKQIINELSFDYYIHFYSFSRGLKRSIEIKSYAQVNQIKSLFLRQLKFFILNNYTFEYWTQYIGMIKYNYYEFQNLLITKTLCKWT